MTRNAILVALGLFGLVAVYGRRARRINALLGAYRTEPELVRRRRKLSEELAEVGV